MSDHILHKQIKLPLEGIDLRVNIIDLGINVMLEIQHKKPIERYKQSRDCKEQLIVAHSGSLSYSYSYRSETNGSTRVARTEGR